MTVESGVLFRQAAALVAAAAGDLPTLVEEVRRSVLSAAGIPAAVADAACGVDAGPGSALVAQAGFADMARADPDGFAGLFVGVLEHLALQVGALAVVGASLEGPDGRGLPELALLYAGMP